MKLPAALQLGIEEELSQFGRGDLTRAADELSSSYRNASGPSALRRRPGLNDLGRAAYLATRVPATYAAISVVLRELRQRVPELEVRSLLDLGAGPGTAMWAASELFRELEQVTLVERTGGFIRVGQRLAAKTSMPAIKNARWVEADLVHETEFPAHDLVVISYALGELAPDDRRSLLERAWQAAAEAITFIEPGTPRGFDVVLQARGELLERRAHLVAPCPHEMQCPMAQTKASDARQAASRKPPQIARLGDDWCHFAQRLERTSLHRKLKSAELGYEDEKFSYIAAARGNAVRAEARVIRHPVQLKGHIKLELCTPEGLTQQTVTRKEGEAFKRARKAKWGEEWK